MNGCGFFNTLEKQMKHLVIRGPGDKSSPKALSIFSATLQSVKITLQSGRSFFRAIREMCQCALTRAGNAFCNKPLQKKAPDGLWCNCPLMLMGHQYSPNHFCVSTLIRGQHRSCFLKLFSFFSHYWLSSTPVSLRNKAGLSFNDVFA